MATEKQLATAAQIEILKTEAAITDLRDALEAVGPNHVLYAPFTEELRLIEQQVRAIKDA